MEENSLNQDPDNLIGMKAAEAKEYIHAFIATLKLTEKEIRSLEDEAAKWKARIELARSKRLENLTAEAEREAEKINSKLSELREEQQSLNERIGVMRRQLPGLAARERSVDPDLLEQELLLALGLSEEEAKTERSFRKLEKDSAADTALEELKNRMREDPH